MSRELRRRGQSERIALRVLWVLSAWIALACELAWPGDASPAAPSRVAALPSGSSAASELLSIQEIQAVRHLSPWQGEWIRAVEGVVTAVDANGFVFQSEAALAKPFVASPTERHAAASRALYVYARARADVSVGDRVQVDGRVAEHRPDCGAHEARGDACPHLSETQLVEPIVRVLEQRVAQPEPEALWGREPPMPNAWLPAAGVDVEGSRRLDPQQVLVDWYEGLERMRVTLPAVRVVQPTRAGEAVVAPLERVEHERGVLRVAPHEARRGIAIPRWTIRFPEAPPELQVGDALGAGLMGVLGYRFGRYRIELASGSATDAVGRGPAPERSALGAAAADEWTLGSWNLYQLHGTSPQARFEAVATMVVDALGAPDLVALQELGDDSGPSDDGRSAAGATLQRLQSSIRDRASLDYRAVALPPADGADGGRPGENIRSALLYRADRGLEYGFASRSGSLSLPHGVVEATRASRFGEEHPAFTSSRKPLVAPFSFRGHDVWVIALHLRSKLGDDPALGRFNPPRAGSASQRLAQARALGELVQQLQASLLAAPVVVVGDVNDEEESPAIGALEEAGLLCLSRWLSPADRYGYIYDGRAMMLDHALVTPRLAEQVIGIDIVHACSEFASCVSDHDPLLVRFRHLR